MPTSPAIPVTVDLCLSTMGARLAQVKLPGPVAGVRHVIVHQDPDAGGEATAAAARALTERGDVTYVPQPGRGLCRSRNACLEAASGDWVYVLDDDVAYDPAQMLDLARAAHADGTQVATYYHRFVDGRTTLNRDTPLTHTLRDVGKPSSYDISFDRRAVLAAGVRFDERFGLGTDLPSGEEMIFLADCLRAGLTVVRYPVELCTHPAVSSGLDFFSTAPKVRAKREMIRRVYGPVAAPAAAAVFWARKAPIAARAGHLGRFTRYLFLPG